MEWKWAKANAMDLAKFVNEESIDLLGKLPMDDRLNLMQNSCGRRKLVKTIYERLIQKGIWYHLEPYQPRAETQLIRTPVEILSTPGPGEGTCLDLALLFCGLCFGYDLLPLLILIEGHAFAAVSLKHNREDWNAYALERTMFEELFQGEQNLAELKKLIEDEAYIAVECTGFAQAKSFSNVEANVEAPEAKGRTSEGVLPFDRAVEAGQEQLNHPNRQFKFAIDIAIAQYDWKIEPLEIPNLSKVKPPPPPIKADAILTYDSYEGGKAIAIDATGTNFEGGANLKANIETKEMTGGEQTGIKLGSA
jgi:hypothetical protein